MKLSHKSCHLFPVISFILPDGIKCSFKETEFLYFAIIQTKLVKKKNHQTLSFTLVLTFKLQVNSETLCIIQDI